MEESKWSNVKLGVLWYCEFESPNNLVNLSLLIILLEDKLRKMSTCVPMARDKDIKI